MAIGRAKGAPRSRLSFGVGKRKHAKAVGKHLLAKTSKEPIVKKKDWHQLPAWIALHAERGEVPKCWEGHRLKKDFYDIETHPVCTWCEKKPKNTSPVLVCRKCNWVICSKCQHRPRLPTLECDPLFHGPEDPGLLQALPGSAANDVGDNSHGTVIICPGGNYEFLVPHEGFPVVEWLARHGIRAFVLRYRLLPNHDLEDMLQDLTNAVEQVRSTYNGPVATMGFSAGGHLAASLALRTKGKTAMLQALDAQVLVYPCIDSSAWGHPDDCGFWDWERSFPAAKSLLVGQNELLGGQGFNAPPTFLVASTADQASPPKEHTDRYAKALRQHQVPFTYLRRDFGPHGFGIQGGWTDKCIAWLRKKGFGAKILAATGGA